MKTVKFNVNEEQYTYLKTIIGFDNLESFLRPVIDRAMESDIHDRTNISRKEN